MNIKNYGKPERFEVCNCCGKSFTAEESMEKAFHDHLEENEDCKGYFNIELKGGRK